MVGFMSHSFNVPFLSRENWFRLLDKYFGGAKFTIISNGNKISTENLSYQWLINNTVGIEGDVEVSSDRIFDNWATRRVLPPLNHSTYEAMLKKMVIPEATEINNINDICEEIINTFSGEEFYDISGFVKVSMYDNKFTPYIINRICQSPSIIGALVLDYDMWFVSNGSYIFQIIPGYVQWAYLPCFDLDDGFLNTQFCVMKPEYLNKLNTMFSEWRAKFDRTNGSNWNDPIIHN